MTKGELLNLAMTVSQAQERLTALGMMDRPEKPEERLRQDAEYRLAQSLLWKAQEQYGSAMRNLSAAALDAIMKEEL